MTKKSHARLLRDAEARRNGTYTKKSGVGKPNVVNSCWDDLNTIYSSCIQLLQKHENISVYASNKEIIDEIVDKNTLISNIRLLASDLNKLSSELQEIHNQHADKSGGTNDPDEVMRSITIYEQYSLFMERHDAVVMPTITYILEQFDQAEHSLLRKRKALAEAADAAAGIVNPTPIERGDELAFSGNVYEQPKATNPA